MVYLNLKGEKFHKGRDTVKESDNSLGWIKPWFEKSSKYSKCKGVENY